MLLLHLVIFIITHEYNFNLYILYIFLIEYTSFTCLASIATTWHVYIYVYKVLHYSD